MIWIRAVGAQHLLKTIRCRLADDQNRILVDDSQHHRVLSLLAAVRLLLEERFLLMRKCREAVAGKDKDGDGSIIHAPGQIRGGLVAELADAGSLDLKARILARRTAHRERNPLAQVAFD